MPYAGEKMSIKITPADKAFSLCVRARANFRCEKCGKQHSHNSKGLHCSHHHSRGNWSIRFDPLNAESLCYGCHAKHGGTEERRKATLTPGEQELLFERKMNTLLGRMYRKTHGKGDIAKHFRDEYKKICEKRERGDFGRIDFEGYYNA